MAGHSKWAQIKRQKGANDQKRGAHFSKLARLITVAARGGADPETNFQLRMVIDQAKAANLPKENIERAIERASGSGAEALEEIMFEAYGPDGSAFLIEAATDNRNRTVGEVRAVLNRNNGKLGESGSVGYLFNKRGQIIVETDDFDTAELTAIEAGAEDFERGEKELFVYTDPKELEQVRKNLEAAGLASSEVSFEYQPTAPLSLNKEAQDKVIKLSEVLEDLEDVNRVHTNVDISEDLLD